MKIVSNTGPLIGLAKIDLLSLLPKIAQEVLIPPMVHRELLGKIGMESEHIDKALRGFLCVTNPHPLDPATEMEVSGLDEGEKQAVSLASRLKGNVLLLMDDHAGREVAKKLTIPTTGLIGLLLLAKGKALIGRIGPLIDKLRQQGYWLSDDVVEISKRLADEK